MDKNIMKDKFIKEVVEKLASKPVIQHGDLLTFNDSPSTFMKASKIKGNVYVYFKGDFCALEEVTKEVSLQAIYKPIHPMAVHSYKPEYFEKVWDANPPKVYELDVKALEEFLGGKVVTR